jgi:hypothetical protein
MLQQGAIATGENWRDNWITPDYIKDAVEAYFLGEYYDPCPEDPKSCGLSDPWGVHAYVNPPFSQYQKWADYGLSQLIAPDAAGRMTWRTIVFLANSNTETKWYQQLAQASHTIILPNKRIKFIDPRAGEAGESPRQGQSLFCLGRTEGTNIGALASLGTVLYTRKGVF